MKSWNAGARLSLLVLITIMAHGASIGTASAQAAPEAIALQALRNLAYPSVFAPTHTPLRDGAYEWNQPPLRGRVVFGDAAIARGRAAVLLSSSTGGSGIFLTMHLVTNSGGALVAGPGVFIGDRQRVEGFTFSGDAARVDLVTQGPNEPQCCPTQRETRQYVVEAGAFRLVSTAVTQPAVGSQPATAPLPAATGHGGVAAPPAAPPAVAWLLLAFAGGLAVAARARARHHAINKTCREHR